MEWTQKSSREKESRGTQEELRMNNGKERWKIISQGCVMRNQVQDEEKRNYTRW
jgi:hypothetical protein